MSNNKQSSIDYLFERFYANEGMITTKQLEKAKAMHKEECITYAHDFARQMLQNRRFVTPEIIYNETFNTKEKWED